MKIVAQLEKDELSTIEHIFGRLTAIKNLVTTLAIENDLYKEKSYLYERLLVDQQETQTLFDTWWDEVISKYHLEEYPIGSLSVNFEMSYIGYQG